MRIISGNTLNETIYKAFSTLEKEGIYQPSRNGGCTALYNNIFSIENPRSRHLSLSGRKSNIFQLIAESFWVLSGSNVLSPYLTFFLPRAPQYSDDGETWEGSYGPRLYNRDQLKGVIDTFRTDGKMTRRAQIAIYDPALDSPQAIASKYGESHKPRDIPCNSFVYAYITPDDKFRLHVTQRSGDLLFGTGSINPFEFTVLQELLYNEVKKMYPEVDLGTYSWYVNNAHVYDGYKDQVSSVLASPQLYNDTNTIPLLGPNIEDFEPFFSELLALYSYTIDYNGIYSRFKEDKQDVIDIFKDYNVQTENNLLFEYALLVLYYIHSKKYPTSYLAYNTNALGSDEVSRAIVNSPFRKFNVI